MGRITDKLGRAWDVEINVSTLGKVRKALDINLLEIILPENKLVEKLSDVVLLVDVLYLVCQSQCDGKGVTDEDFGKNLTRDNIDDGWDSILESVVNFSPRGVRPAYQKVLEKARKFKTLQEQRVETEIQKPTFDAILDKAMEGFLNPPESSPIVSLSGVGSSAESSESTPANTI